MANISGQRRYRRKQGIRKRVVGTQMRPRLTVFRSLKHVYAQVINDETGKTIAQASSLAVDASPPATGETGDTSVKRLVAQRVGEILAKACTSNGVKQVVFDRNGYRYHGRIAALATGAREGGLDF